MGQLPFAFEDRFQRVVVVREAHEADAADLVAYYEQVDRESVYLSREPGELRTTIEQERQRISRARGQVGAIALVAHHESLLVGALDFQAGVKKRSAHAGEFGVSVREAYWGAGIGGQLLDALIRWAQREGLVRKIKLRVHADNQPALALYRARGFVEEGRLARELRIADAWVDVLLLALWLDA